MVQNLLQKSFENGYQVLKLKLYILNQEALGKMATMNLYNGRMRDEFLNGEIFYSLKEVQVVVEMWRREYNQVRPHSSLCYKSPAPVAVLPIYLILDSISTP